MGELQGRIALISGASRGIGAACAAVMAREGADVIINYQRSVADAEAVSLRVRELGRRALVIQADVTDATQVRKMVDRTIAEWGRVDILVNNVGHHSTRAYAVEDVTLEQWYQAMDINLTSQMLCIQAVLPGMLRQRWGRIVNLGSVTAERGSLSGDVCYTASKAGVHGLTLALFRRLAPLGITVNTLSPGTIDTPMTRDVLSPERIRAYAKEIPMGRVGRPEEVAEAICFLTSDRASFITGQLIAVNGGAYV